MTGHSLGGSLAALCALRPTFLPAYLPASCQLPTAYLYCLLPTVHHLPLPTRCAYDLIACLPQLRAPSGSTTPSAARVTLLTFAAPHMFDDACYNLLATSYDFTACCLLPAACLLPTTPTTTYSLPPSTC